MSKLGLWGLKKSPWVYHVAAASCNNCDIEILELLTPRYDVERFGVVLVGSPRHADALLVAAGSPGMTVARAIQGATESPSSAALRRWRTASPISPSWNRALPMTWWSSASESSSVRRFSQEAAAAANAPSW